METSAELQCSNNLEPRNSGESLAVTNTSGCDENTNENCNIAYERNDSQEATVDGDLDPRIQVSSNYFSNLKLYPGHSVVKLNRR